MTINTRYATHNHYIAFDPNIHYAAELVENGPRLNEIAKWLKANTNSYVNGEYKIEGKYKFWFTDPKEAIFFLLRWG